MESIVNQVTALAKDADEGVRKQLLDTLMALQLSIETPNDSMYRIIYLNVYMMAVRIGKDLKLFNLLNESPDSLTAKQVAEKCGTAENLMSKFNTVPKFAPPSTETLRVARLLRYLGSVGIVKETGPSIYTASTITKALATRGWQGAVHHYFDLSAPCFAETPEFLKRTGYADIEDPTNCPFNVAHNTNLTLFGWFSQPEPKNQWLLTEFHHFMSVQREGMPSWLSVYPYLDTLKTADPEQPLFVDVGGGFGHQSVLLREALPEDIKNRIIVQDLAPVISQAKPYPGVELTTHNFWEPQPVKNAKMYYVRNILHDWTDAKAAEILKNIKGAMGPDSVVIIDEMIIPEQGAHWQATQLDMLMMTALGSQERTEKQWTAIATAAGLRIRKVYHYTLSLNDSIMELVAA